MSVEQIQATLLKLPREARREFADWFYQNENQILDPRDDDDISPEVMADILRRRQTALANPQQLASWGGTANLRAQLDEIRRQKSQTR